MYLFVIIILVASNTEQKESWNLCFTIPGSNIMNPLVQNTQQSLPQFVYVICCKVVMSIPYFILKCHDIQEWQFSGSNVAIQCLLNYVPHLRKFQLKNVRHWALSKSFLFFCKRLFLWQKFVKSLYLIGNFTLKLKVFINIIGN